MDKDVLSSGALVLFSGGQDSTTCLAWALSRYKHVETIGFFYGQSHAIELTMREPIREATRHLRPDWSERLGMDHVIDLSVINAVSMSALTTTNPCIERSDGLPSTFVPGRNIVFLTFAAIVAEQRALKTLITGTCETDFSGYPDCRDDTIKALQVTLNLGMQARLIIEAPLMWIDKRQTWQLAQDLGGMDLVNLVSEMSHTCYDGDRQHKHPWGYGCNNCDACRLRSNGWAAFIATAGDVVPGAA